MQSDACHWFYAPIYVKWLPLLIKLIAILMQSPLKLSKNCSYPVELFNCYIAKLLKLSLTLLSGKIDKNNSIQEFVKIESRRCLNKGD